jgi:signal transduction histidine kinase
MSKLVGDLLYLAKTDNAELNSPSLPYNISGTVSEALLSMETIAYEKGLTLTQSIEPDIIINGDSGKLAQVIKILFDNAVKYSDESGRIDISLVQTKNQVIFSIMNTGEGIPQKHLTKLFYFFYRGDPSRTYDGIYGLGLSIATANIDNMGGKIYAASIEEESTTFTFILNR